MPSKESILIQAFEMTSEDFNRIRHLIYKHAGIALGENKREMVYGRLVRRLRKLGVERFSHYIPLVEKNTAGELEEFINALTTNLTSFFRESHHFPVLSAHLSEKIGQREIYIWSAAASTGEEPYSIAMTAADIFGLNNLPVKIFATDLNSAVLEIAKKGCYSESDVKKLPDNKIKLYFKTPPQSAGKIQVRDELKKIILFEQLNLLSPYWKIKGPLDVIFCRNVLIYFDRPSQRQILERFAALLKPNGLLFVGHSESLFHSADLFKSMGHTVYMRAVS